MCAIDVFDARFIFYARRAELEINLEERRNDTYSFSYVNERLSFALTMRRRHMAKYVVHVINNK